MSNFKFFVRGGDVLKKCIYFGAALGLAWLFMQLPTESVLAQQQDPAAALGQIEEGQQRGGDQRLESLDGLSDEEVRDIYLNKPSLLPSEITEAEWERIREIVHVKGEGENDGS
jgi:hypothetical protein